MAIATPLYVRTLDVGGWAVAQHADGRFQASSPGTVDSGGASACNVWRGWGSMGGGRLDGEETLSSRTSSSNGSGPPYTRRVGFKWEKVTHSEWPKPPPFFLSSI